MIEAAGDRSAGSITTAQLKVLVQHFREEREWSVGQTNHFIRSIKVFYNFLEREEFIATNPARRLAKLKGAQRIPEPLTPDEIKALLAEAGDGFTGLRNAAMMLILLDCGLRLTELMEIKVGDVDFAQSQIKVFGKGRKERIVPFSGTVRRFLIKYMALRQARTFETALWIDEEGYAFATSGFKSFIVRLERRTGRTAAPENNS